MRIVMDDAGDVPADIAEKYKIRIVPVNITFGTEEFLSDVTMDRPAFYAKTAHVTPENFPKTSQPTPYQYAEVYREIFDDGADVILSITISEKLSGTYASAIQAAKEMEEEGRGKVYVFDSKAGAAAQGYFVIEAARMAHEGAPIENILTRLERMRLEMSVRFTIDSLEYARKGGRVSNVKSVMASLLNIKPILTLNDGLIVEAGRVRTRKKALGQIVDEVHQEVGDKRVRVAVMHANTEGDAEQLRARAESTLNAEEILVVDMAIPVAINLGPGALGIVAVPV